MDKLTGTISTSSAGKKVESIQVTVKIKSNVIFKVADINLQEGQGCTQHNRMPLEQYVDEQDEMHFNFLARGVTTIIMPYMSDVPFNTAGELLPNETDYITTPIKADILIHKPFTKQTEFLALGAGLNSDAKRFELNENVEQYTKCIYDGYTSKQLIGGRLSSNAFIGRELRLANADSKFTLSQNEKRKTTGVLYANKTRRRV